MKKKRLLPWFIFFCALIFQNCLVVKLQTNFKAIYFMDLFHILKVCHKIFFVRSIQKKPSQYSLASLSINCFLIAVSNPKPGSTIHPSTHPVPYFFAQKKGANAKLLYVRTPNLCNFL